MGIFTGVMLVALGFLIAAVVGVLTGFISLAPLTGKTPAAAVALPAAAPAADAVQTAAATPEAAVPQPRVLREETYGDWRYYCLEGVGGAAPVCSTVQQLRIAETGAAVFIWRISQDGHGGLVGTWQVPETVLLGGGLTLDAGTPKPLTVPFDGCGAGSCQVVANLAPDFIQALTSAKTLSASIVLKNRENVKFPLSPKGLGDALAALQK